MKTSKVDNFFLHCFLQLDAVGGNLVVRFAAMADAEKLFHQIKRTKFGGGFKYPYRDQIV